jgi:hypothetical protein
MATQTSNLFLLENLDDRDRTSNLPEDELTAVRAVADWIRAFIAKPHPDLGRGGPVCPFVPSSLDHKTLWLAPEKIADREPSDVVELMSGYKNLLYTTEPIDGDDATSKVIVVVFTDLPAERAEELFGSVLQRLAVPSYADAGNLFGPFYEGNEGTAIYNSAFRPFQSPVPLLFVRNGVVSDWKFFLENDEMLALWARRFGDSTTRTLAEELRRLPWREHPPQSA